MEKMSHVRSMKIERKTHWVKTLYNKLDPVMDNHYIASMVLQLYFVSASPSIGSSIWRNRPKATRTGHVLLCTLITQLVKYVRVLHWQMLQAFALSRLHCCPASPNLPTAEVEEHPPPNSIHRQPFSILNFFFFLWTFPSLHFKQILVQVLLLSIHNRHQTRGDASEGFKELSSPSQA